VGCLVGFTGLLVGLPAGFLVGATTGLFVGADTGFLVLIGFLVGFFTGFLVGFSLGGFTGFLLGDLVGFSVGSSVGSPVGEYGGITVGSVLILGTEDGTLVTFGRKQCPHALLQPFLTNFPLLNLLQYFLTFLGASNQLHFSSAPDTSMILYFGSFSQQYPHVIGQFKATSASKHNSSRRSFFRIHLHV